MQFFIHMIAQFKSSSVSIYKTKILTTIDFTLTHNQCIYIKGQNGSGKTIFMETLLGFHKPRLGSVTIQLPNTCFIPDTSFFTDEETIGTVLKTYALFYKIKLHDIEAILKTLDLNLNTKSKIATLSLGTKKKLELLPLFFPFHDLYVLDEIFHGLDEAMVLLVGKKLQEHFNKGASIVFTEHTKSIVSYLNYLIPKMEVYLCANKKLFKVS